MHSLAHPPVEPPLRLSPDRCRLTQLLTHGTHNSCSSAPNTAPTPQQPQSTLKSTQQSLAGADIGALLAAVHADAPPPRPVPRNESARTTAPAETDGADRAPVSVRRRSSTQLLDHTYVQHMSVPAPDLRPANSVSRLPTKSRQHSIDHDHEPPQHVATHAVPVFDCIGIVEDKTVGRARRGCCVCDSIAAHPSHCLPPQAGLAGRRGQQRHAQSVPDARPQLVGPAAARHCAPAPSQVRDMPRGHGFHLPHRGSIYCVEWSADGTQLASASNDKCIHILSFGPPR